MNTLIFNLAKNDIMLSSLEYPRSWTGCRKKKYLQTTYYYAKEQIFHCQYTCCVRTDFASRQILQFRIIRNDVAIQLIFVRKFREPFYIQQIYYIIKSISYSRKNCPRQIYYFLWCFVDLTLAQFGKHWHVA